jgi:hypothetical protein
MLTDGLNRRGDIGPMLDDVVAVLDHDAALSRAQEGPQARAMERSVPLLDPQFAVLR